MPPGKGNGHWSPFCQGALHKEKTTAFIRVIFALALRLNVSISNIPTCKSEPTKAYDPPSLA